MAKPIIKPSVVVSNNAAIREFYVIHEEFDYLICTLTAFATSTSKSRQGFNEFLKGATVAQVQNYADKTFSVNVRVTEKSANSTVKSQDFSQF